MKHLSRCVLITSLLLNATSAQIALAAPELKAILQKADEARGNVGGIEWEVAIESSDSSSSSRMIFDVKASGFDILAESLYPPMDKGNKVLMVNGNMWFYKPGLSKAVPVSRRQKLIGDAAYGDIASTNYAEDYSASLLPFEIVNGEKCYVYDLKANSSKATYERIIYWVSVDRVLGLKAEYYTVSGKKFKSATLEYQNSITIDGELKPFISRMKIKDEIVHDKETVLSFENAKLAKLSNHVFNINLLGN